MNPQDKHNQSGEDISWLRAMGEKPHLPRLPEFQEGWLEMSPVHSLSEDEILVTDIATHRNFRLIYGAVAALFLVFFTLPVYFYLQRGGATGGPDQTATTQKLEGPVAAKKAITLSVHGTVAYERKGEKFNLHSGDALYQGDLIRTGDSGAVDLLLGEGVTIRLKENSLFLLETFQTVGGKEQYGVFLEKGQLISQIRKLKSGDSYEVTTPTAIAGVRGTSFVVEVTPESTQVALLNGSVEVKKKGEESSTVVLTEEEMVEVVPGSDMVKETIPAPKVKAVSDEIREISGSGTTERELLSTVNEITDVKSEKEIEEIYNRSLEVIRLKDGRILRGVVAQQIQTKLIIHTANGIFIVNSEDLVDIQYLPSSREEETPETEEPGVRRIE